MNPQPRRSRKTLLLSVLVALLLLLAVGGWVGYVYVTDWIQAAREAARERASVGGKYVHLLRQIRVPQDRASYKDFNDYGFSPTQSYAGYQNIPGGYWVYSYPHWYIWRDCTQPQANPNLRQQPVEVVTPPKALPADQALEKASVDGKYQMLLRQIDVASDSSRYPAGFHDSGFSATSGYGVHTDLPAGHWVFVYPYWYIWRDLAGTPAAKRPRGPEQAIGIPDSPSAGSSETAWQADTSAGGDWLLVEFEQAVVPSAVLVHENQHPGAVTKVSVFGLDGREREVWSGVDPTKPSAAHGVSEIPLQFNEKISRVKVWLAKRPSDGEPEIDAVGLVDAEGELQWARAAAARSRPESLAAALPKPAPTPQQRIAELEEEVRQLKATIAELRAKAKKEP